VRGVGGVVLGHGGWGMGMSLRQGRLGHHVGRLGHCVGTVGAGVGHGHALVTGGHVLLAGWHLVGSLVGSLLHMLTGSHAGNAMLSTRTSVTLLHMPGRHAGSHGTLTWSHALHPSHWHSHGTVRTHRHPWIHLPRHSPREVSWSPCPDTLSGNHAGAPWSSTRVSTWWPWHAWTACP